jgi:hypothetical protein
MKRCFAIGGRDTFVVLLKAGTPFQCVRGEWGARGWLAKFLKCFNEIVREIFYLILGKESFSEPMAYLTPPAID